MCRYDFLFLSEFLGLSRAIQRFYIDPQPYRYNLQLIFITLSNYSQNQSCTYFFIKYKNRYNH